MSSLAWFECCVGDNWAILFYRNCFGVLKRKIVQKSHWWSLIDLTHFLFELYVISLLVVCKFWSQIEEVAGSKWENAVSFLSCSKILSKRRWYRSLGYYMRIGRTSDHLFLSSLQIPMNTHFFLFFLLRVSFKRKEKVSFSRKM